MIDSRTTVGPLLAACVFAWLSCLAGFAGAAEETAPARALPVGNRQLCQRCHEDLAEVLGGAHVHAPVAADTCTGCHSPHAANHGNLLREAGRDLCLSCHTGTVKELDAPVLHGVMRSERACLSCHEAHASDQGALLLGEESSVCTGCHEPIRAKLAQANPHAPAAIGACSDCHEPHAGNAAGLLDQPVPALCVTCHEADAELRKSHAGFDIGDADCLSCHDPHGTKAAKLVRDVVHAVFEPGSCDTCHASTRDPRQFELTQPELCVQCHDQWDAAPAERQHPLGEDVRCTSCHSPHAGESPAMLRGAPRSLCLSCHGEIRTEIDRAASFHPLEADEGRCTACHGPHDAAERPLLARPAETLCAGCHTDHSRFAHPMGPNVPDPLRPGLSLNCLSCHDPHASRYKMLLLASPDRDLCVRCHKNLH